MSDAAVSRAPKISVCVPTYNRAAFLKPFLASIFRQTLTDFEVIVSDNASTDGTSEVLATISEPRLRCHRNAANLGPFGNMNTLLGLARGEYVAIVHDDDIYEPEFLERLSGLLDQHHNVGMVHCAVHEVDPNGVPQRLVCAYPTTRVVPGDEEFIRYLQGHNVCCSSAMARRSVYLDAGPFDTTLLCSDYLMWAQLALRADVGYVAEPLVQMRVHAFNVTSSLNPERWHSEFVIILERGIEIAARLKPALVRDRLAIVTKGARMQGRRFLIAELAAVSHGDYPLARGYIEVLDKLRALGLSRAYVLTARLLTNRFGQRLLLTVARVRRARARRSMESFDRKTARA